MQYSPELIDKIYNYKTLSNNEKINRLLEIDANQYKLWFRNYKI